MAVRLASLHDLPRTARISLRGFSLSPWNVFYRPCAKAFPGDVEDSYRREQLEALGDLTKLFTVIELANHTSDTTGFAL